MTVILQTPMGQQMPSVPEAGPRPSSPRLRPVTADRIVQRAEQLYRLGMSIDGEPFAVPRDGNGVAVLLRESGEEIMERLAADFHTRDGRPPKGAALREAMAVLCGLAAAKLREVLHLRLARHAGRLFIDIGDATGKVIVVTPGVGYRVQNHSPVLFRRTALTAPLPIPAKGKHLEDIRKFVNVSDSGFEAVVGWLIAAWIPDITHPIALLTGPVRAGKSCGAETLLSLIDPSKTPRVCLPRTPSMWQREAAQRRGVLLDDVRSINPAVSDAILASITGNGVYWSQPGRPRPSAVRNTVLMTAVDPWGVPGALGEHLLPIELMPIPERTWLDEHALAQLRGELLPGIFGALLSGLASTLGRLRTEKPAALPRMAEFGRVLRAADASLVTMQAHGDFIGGQAKIWRKMLERDAFGTAVREFAWAQGRWEGTPEELWKLLKPECGRRRSQNWPTIARVSGRLKSCGGQLAEHGVLIEWQGPGDDGGPERLRICVVEGPGDSTSPSAGPQDGADSADDEQHHFHAMAMMNDDRADQCPF